MPYVQNVKLSIRIRVETEFKERMCVDQGKSGTQHSIPHISVQASSFPRVLVFGMDNEITYT